MSDPSTAQPSGPALTKEQEAAMASSDPASQQPVVAPPPYTPAGPGQVAYIPGSAQPVAYLPGTSQPVTVVVSFYFLKIVRVIEIVKSLYLYVLKYPKQRSVGHRGGAWILAY